MSVKIGHASIDENGKISGGAAGDQTKAEVCTREWYAKGWNKLIRPKDSAIAEKIAAAMEAACKNDNVGYDQNQRTTLYTQAKAKNWNISDISTKCECDCSSLVAVCVNAAGISVSKDIYTGNEAAALKNTGKFDVLTDSKYLTSDKYLKRGDILLKESSHTAIALSNGSAAGSTPATSNTTGSNSEKTIWNFLTGKGLNDFAAAGIMGNLYAESGLRPNNLQNSSEKKLNMTDLDYTAAVDSGSYTKFSSDAAGYGLAQWTYSTRKKALLDFAKAAKKSIGDLNMQLDFFWKEIQGYSAVMSVLKKASSVLEASNAVLTGYEKPADQGASVQAKRAEYGQAYYNKYASKKASAAQKQTAAAVSKEKVDPAQSFNKSLAGSYKTTTGLRLRAGAGTSKKILIVMPEGTAVQNYGYYTAVSGTKWLYVQTTIKGTTYTGFCSSKYLKKQ